MTGQDKLDVSRDRVATIDNEVYNVVSTTNGHCDGCAFLHYEGGKVVPCPGAAIKYCINGNILKK